MTLIDTIKNWKNKREQDMLQDEVDEESPPRQIRDRHLESLERENQFQDNQDRKELLKKKIALYKKKKMAEQLYGIKEHREKEQSYLNSDTSRKVQILKDGNNILRQKSMMHQKSILGGNSLLNNHVREFKKRKR